MSITILLLGGLVSAWGAWKGGARRQQRMRPINSPTDSYKEQEDTPSIWFTITKHEDCCVAAISPFVHL